jgi:RNA polymerase sigma factor (sigma-70 family)
MSNLFRQFLAGNADAYKAYYKRYYANVYASLRRLCAGDDALAQDLTQDVFKHCWDRRGTFTDDTHLANYLFFMAQNLFLQQMRKRRMAEVATEEMRREMLAADADAELAIAREHVLARVENTMMKLPPQQKMVMDLIVHYGLDIKTVAKRLQLAEQTVRNHKSQALIFLRKELYGGSLSVLLFLTFLIVFFYN